MTEENHPHFKGLETLHRGPLPGCTLAEKTPAIADKLITTLLLPVSLKATTSVTRVTVVVTSLLHINIRFPVPLPINSISRHEHQRHTFTAADLGETSTPLNDIAPIMHFPEPSNLSMTRLSYSNSPWQTSRVVIVSTILTRKLEFERSQANFLERLGHRADIAWATTPSEVVDLFVSIPLSNTPPHAILLIDKSLLFPQNGDVLDLVRRYIRQGGTVITMWHFGTPEPDDHTHRLYFNDFFSRLGPGWILGEHQKANIVLNPKAVEQNEALVRRLPPCFTVEGHCVRVRQESHSCYTPSGFLDQTPIAYACAGRGDIGYVGDCQWPMDNRSVMVIIAMCHLNSQ